MTRKITTEIITILFIILWMYAGLSKLLEYEKFKFQLGRSPYVEGFAPQIAWLLPTAEIMIALTLVTGVTRLIGMYASFFLMLVFTGYIYAMLNYSYFIPCSCGGILSQLDWHSHLLFNIAFTILGGIGVLSIKPGAITKQTRAIG